MRNLSRVENQGRQVEVAYRAHKLLKELPNVRDLVLSYDMVKALNYREEFFTHMRVFLNLSGLQLNLGAVNFACGALQKLLQNCSSLTSLQFRKGITLYTSGGAYAWKLDPVPSCFLTGLKNAYIGDFKLKGPEQHVTSLLIENVSVLERLCVKLRGGSGNKEEDSSHRMVIPIRSNCEMGVHI